MSSSTASLMTFENDLECHYLGVLLSDLNTFIATYVYVECFTIFPQYGWIIFTNFMQQIDVY